MTDPPLRSSPERYHVKAKHPGEFETTCWNCGRGRAFCKAKLAYVSWQSADVAVKDINESRAYAEPVVRYLHGLNHRDIPIDGVLGFDEATGEYRIRQFRKRNGRFYMDDDGEIVSCVVRRVPRAPLPWRRVEAP